MNTPSPLVQTLRDCSAVPLQAASHSGDYVEHRRWIHDPRTNQRCRSFSYAELLNRDTAGK